MNKFMKIALDAAKNGSNNNEGGPFGAVIVDKNNNIISIGNNRVLIDNDPTAHAEIIAIRRATQKLNTYDLSNLILYTSCEPCPMCLSAIIWSNIKDIYYAGTKKDAAKIGFRDDAIYDYLNGKNPTLLNLNHIEDNSCITLFEEYQNNNKIIY